jgi:hypothetical protein
MNKDINEIKYDSPFIFSISFPNGHRNQPKWYRTGIRWDFLLKDNISVEQLNFIFKRELKRIQKKYPNLHIARNKNLRNSCHYIAPEGMWTLEIKYNVETFIHEFIPRINSLLSNGALSSWIAAQLITGILTTLSQQYQKSKTFIWLASQLVNGSIMTFKNILENPARPRKQENFFSFIFNLYQQLLGDYGISVSHKLVDLGLPSTFLKDIYFKHENNHAARKDLWDWCTDQQDFFGEKFYGYWHERGYCHSDISHFEKSILPYLGSSEESETTDLLSAEYEYSPQQNFYSQFNSSPLFLCTTVVSSPIVSNQSLPTTPIYRIEPSYSPVLLWLSPMPMSYVASTEMPSLTAPQDRVAHIRDSKAESATTPQGISQQLKNSLEIRRFSQNTQGLLVNSSHQNEKNLQKSTADLIPSGKHHPMV